MRFEGLERRVMLASIVGGRASPDPLDEAILFRFPLDADTVTHFYYDRDPTAGTLAWNGTSQSYNGHTGSDFSGGPRGKPVYAGADGILIAKEDGWPDQGGSGNGNYVRLNHGNDRNGNPIVSWYLHFNAGTVTTKPLGSFIAAGELIGGVGTSGNSTGLHLHFHFQYAGVAYDPFAASGEASWWQNQGSGSPSTATPVKKFSIGDYAEVFAATANVRSPNAESAVIGSQPEGAVGQIIAGPVLSSTDGNNTSNVYTRWKVQFNDGMTGWVAQNWLRDAPADVTVERLGTIPDGQTTPVSFGSVEKNKPGVIRIFTVRNLGGQALTLGAVTAPSGFSVVEGLVSSLAPGASDTLTIRMESGVVGTKSGQLSFVNSDPNENPYNFAIEGTVTPDVTAPTVDVVDVTPDPTSGPLGSVAIVFSEPVLGFDKNDLTLSRNGGAVSLASAVLSGSGANYTLSNLAGLSAASGTYTLTVVSGGVTDDSGNALQAEASDTVKVQTSLFRGDATGTIADSYYLRRSGDGTKLEVFENVSPGPTPTYAILLAGLSSVVFDTGAGNNSVTIDYAANGSPLPAGFSYLASGGGVNDLRFVGTGEYTFNTDAALTTPNLRLTVESTTVNFAASQHLESLTVLDDAIVTMTGSDKVLVTKSLSIGTGGALDLRGNDMIVDYSSVSPIGTWNGGAYSDLSGLLATGKLFSSDASPDGYTMLGIAEASDARGISGAQTAEFSGETVDASSVLVKFTYGGDANLSGSVDVDDYGAIDFNASTGGAIKGWFDGDFNLDGSVDVDDYGIIDFAVNIQGAEM